MRRASEWRDLFFETAIDRGGHVRLDRDDFVAFVHVIQMEALDAVRELVRKELPIEQSPNAVTRLVGDRLRELDVKIAALGDRT